MLLIFLVPNLKSVRIMTKPAHGLRSQEPGRVQRQIQIRMTKNRQRPLCLPQPRQLELAPGLQTGSRDGCTPITRPLMLLGDQRGHEQEQKLGRKLEVIGSILPQPPSPPPPRGRSLRGRRLHINRPTYLPTKRDQKLKDSRTFLSIMKDWRSFVWRRGRRETSSS